MIARIVIMHFKPEAIESFQRLFSEKAPHIRRFPGCLHLELYQMNSSPPTFMTYSIWESEAALNAYRNSSLFQATWSTTKTLFQAPPTVHSFSLLP